MYRSPLRLIQGIQVPQDAGEARRMLVLEKKKLMAEFELTGAATISIKGQELHRHDIITLFDELGHADRLRYHLAIWQDEPLLHFLEEAEIVGDGRWVENPVYDEGGFRQFISPYFARAVNAFMQRLIAGGIPMTEELQALQINKSLLLPGDTETAYRYATRFYTEKKNELLGMVYRADVGEEVSPKEISEWCRDHHIHLLNRLPGTFAALRYTLANLLNNLCVIYDKKKKNDHALAAVERAATIRVNDDELNKLIPSNLGIVRSKGAKGIFNINPTTGRRRPKIGFIIALFIIIIRIAGCFLSTDHSTSYSGSNDLHNLPSFNTADLMPKPRLLTYHSLLKSLMMQGKAGYTDTLFGHNIYHLRRPSAAGEDIFRGLNIYGFARDTASALRTGGNTLLINNQTAWEAILIYQIADTEIHAAYVPPHSAYTLGYSGSRFSTQLYAGKLWSDTVVHAFKGYATPYYAQEHILYGGYKYRARMILEDTTGEPMFTRLTEDKAHNDTLSLVEGIGMYDIHPIYSLSED